MAALNELETLSPDAWMRYQRLRQSEKYKINRLSLRKGYGETALILAAQMQILYCFVAQRPGCTIMEMIAHYNGRIGESRIRHVMKCLLAEKRVEHVTLNTYKAT